VNGFVNLLPWKCRKAQLVRLRLVQWSVAWVVVGALVAAACVVKWDEYSTIRDQTDRLEQALAPTNALLAEIKTLGQAVEQLRAHETAVAQLESPRPALTLLALVSRSAQECEGRLRVEQLTVTSSQLSGGSRQQTTDNRQLSTDNCPPATSVAIKGVAVDDLAVARFVRALRQTKAFDRVELRGTGDGGRGAGDGGVRVQGAGFRVQGSEPASSTQAPSPQPLAPRPSRTRSYEIECGY
jgi:Tfp pilus assembly protein PilN